MSLLTRCPACTTIYKVVPDQLRISQGWVKCGQCGDIFDASQHLVHIEPEKLPQETFQAGLVDDEALLVEEQATVDKESDVTEPGSPQQTGDDASLTDQVSENEQQQEQEDEQKSDASTHYLNQAKDTLLEPVTAEQSQQEITANAQDLSFMRSYRRSQFWRKRWVRVGLVALVIVLILSLMGQWVYRERHFLAASKPQLQPALYAFCDLLGCQVEALQQIESLSIDAAAFNKVDDTHYRLSFALKNAASVPLAAPSIELTLTDLQDMVVLRRVFSARELDGKVNLLSQASQWQASVSLRLETDDAMQRVVGYRVLAFYP